MIHNNKGISPLIATVLLIGFTVALAAVIMTWGTDFIRGTTQNVDDQQKRSLICVNKLDYQIREVNCAAGTVVVDNRGELDIISMKLRLHKPTGAVDVQDITTPLTAFGQNAYTVTNPLNTYNKVDIIPTVKTIDGTFTCTEARRERTFSCP